MIDLDGYRSEAARLSQLIDEANTTLREAAFAQAEAERTYRREKATAWARCPIDAPGVKAGEREWTSARREAWVNAETADLRYQRDHADAARRSAYESLRSRQAQMSMLQSLMSADREEMAFTRTAPA